MNSVEIGQVAQIFNGKTPSKLEQRDAGHPVLKIKDVTDDGQFKGCFESFIEEGLAQKLVAKFAALGDTLILNAAHNAEYVGSKKFLANIEVAGALVTGEWLVVRPDINKLDAKFAHYWFLGTEAHAAVRDLVKGIHLYPKDVARIRLPFPPLDEQRRIAAILDKADALRRKRKRALDLLDSLTQSIFLEMFGDPVTNPRAFSFHTFGNVGRLDRGVSKHRPRNDPALLGGDHPLIQTGDVANSGGYIKSYRSTYSEAGLKQSRKWPIGTLCITIAANIGQTGILSFPACFPDSVVGFTHENPAVIEYIRVWLTFLRENLEKTAPAVAQKNINLEILRELKVMMPPDELIEEFACKIQRRSKIENDLRRLAHRGDLLFHALQSRAFSGQL